METSALFEAEDDDDHCSSSAASSIGNDSDVLSETECGHNDNEPHEPLDTMDSLQHLLPIRRGISKFYDGKSKSFTSLADAGSSPSIKDIGKQENAYARRRRNLMAFNHIWEKTRNLPLGSNNGGISKRTISSSRSAAALAFAINYDSSTSCASEDSSSSSNPRSSPPLPPLHRVSRVTTAPTSPMPHYSAWRPFSLADLQNCATAATINIPSSSLGNEAPQPHPS